MIGNCDCCDRENVPVGRFNATGAHPEGVACFICRGDENPDPFGELEDEREQDWIDSQEDRRSY